MSKKRVRCNTCGFVLPDKRHFDSWHLICSHRGENHLDHGRDLKQLDTGYLLWEEQDEIEYEG